MVVLEKQENLVSFLSIPSGRADLGYLIRLSIGDDARLDIVRVNQVLPRLVIEMEDGLVPLDALFFHLGRFTGRGCIYAWRLDFFSSLGSGKLTKCREPVAIAPDAHRSFFDQETHVK